MVGDRSRRQFAETIKSAADKAGNLVSAAFALAGAALLLSLAVLVFALRTRRPA
jgi:hypothetical protein